MPYKVVLLDHKMHLAGMVAPRTVNMFDIINAILYVLRNACVWRDLPHDFPKWQTVYSYFRRFLTIKRTFLIPKCTFGRDRFGHGRFQKDEF
jgi:putative transposase